MAVQDEGLTEFKRTRESVLDEATKKIRAARDLAEAIVYAGGGAVNTLSRPNGR